MTRRDRKRAYLRGRWAEFGAATLLRLKGYRVLEQGYKTVSGEIDLIARKGRLLVFVEVKARPSPNLASAAIGKRQRHRIHRAAEIFLQRNPGLADCDCRFDAILITPKHWPRHIRDAWRESSD